MDLGLKGKRAIVTGGTRGIGRAIAETLADEGASIAFCARNAGEVAEAQAALKAKGVAAYGAVADIADAEAFKAWVAEATKQLGGVDVLIHNASGFGSGNTEAAWRQGLDVDVLGVQRAAIAAMPQLEAAAEKNGDAAIVIISSVSAAEARSADAYGAMKAAQIHFAKGLAKEKAAKKVRVNVVSPGTIYFEGGYWHCVEQNQAGMFKAVFAMNPLGRMGAPQDIANAVVFLASPRSSFTTGANVVVDGAFTQRVNF